VNVAQLIEVLQTMNEDKEVRVALRQAYNTLEYNIHIGESGDAVYLGTGDQIGYANDSDIEW